jgi:hypothetical protein
MKLLCLILAAISTATLSICADSGSAKTGTNGVVFREPFTLKLHVDKEHYYEQGFSKIPYVYRNDVYLFKGDSFGVDLHITNGAVQGVSYQPDTNNAAVSFRFTQEIKDDGNAMMLLVIQNHTQHKLFMDALMTMPQREKPASTSILPIESGLSGYESWPHPIVQLVLRNIRLTETPKTKFQDQ